MKDQRKRVCIICALFVVMLLILGGSIFLRNNLFHKKVYSSIEAKVNSNNFVKFHENVRIANYTNEVQRNFAAAELEGKTYILKYDEELPEFFKDMKKNEIFCVYPDKTAKQTIFNMGFCGKFISCKQEKETYYIQFTIPKLKEVFSDVYLNTNGEDSTSISSANFYPTQNVSVDFGKSPQKLLKAMSNQSKLCTGVIKESISIGETEAGFTYEKGSQQSLLKDYILLCDKLKLKLKNKSSSDICDLIINGSVTLEQPAVKMILDYHYDKKKDKVKVKDYSIGFITKQKVDLSMGAEKELGLDELNADLSDLIQIIDIEDVTESEKGKLVLGTYLIGIEAALPVLYNDTNKVSYLSLGVAIQLTVTANGKLSLEYNIEESGFTQIEENANGKNTYLSKGYDYPNPVIDSTKPTKEQRDSHPEVTTKVKGEASLDLGVGIDTGICILGMIPMKLATNVVELEMTRSFSESSDDEDEIKEIYKNQYILDNDVNSLLVSSNSYLKMYLGAKVKLGVLKYNIGKTGGSVLLYKDVVFQYPNPIGFTHSQCGFGGVYVGEKYSDSELSEAYQTYAETVGIDGILSSVKDSLVGTVVNNMLSNVGEDILKISDNIDFNVEDYKFDYYSSGVLYIRNNKNVVVAAFITDEEIFNEAGFHTGCSYKKTEEIYSAPEKSYHVEIDIGWIVRKLLGMEDFENMDIIHSEYQSGDSNDIMELIYSEDELKLIIVTQDKS